MTFEVLVVWWRSFVFEEAGLDPIRRTLEVAFENVERGGKPFSCVVVRAGSGSGSGEVVAESPNLVAQTSDPTAHAEVIAIRQACQKLGTTDLEGHDIYVMAHPCPMCLGALYYANPERVVFIVTREEEARYYKDDRRYFELETFYDEFSKPWQERRLPMIHQPDEAGTEVYRRWRELNG